MSEQYLMKLRIEQVCSLAVSIIVKSIPALAVAVLGGLVVFAVLTIYEKRTKKSLEIKKWSVALMGYIFFLLNLTILFRVKRNTYKVVLVPFCVPGGWHLNLFYAIANAVVFIPYGIILSVILRGKATVWRIGGSALICTSIIELAQLLLKRGDCQTEDVLMNVIGAVIGYWIHKCTSVRKGIKNG